jgi:insulysin
MPHARQPTQLRLGRTLGRFSICTALAAILALSSGAAPLLCPLQAMSMARATPHLPPWIVEDTSGISKDPVCFPSRAVLKLRYPNGVRAYLVSDQSLGAVFVSAAVGHGSFDDPDAHPGLAHLLEHVLFQGSRQYPRAGEFLEFCQANGGQRNGITYGDRSIYAIQIDRPALEEACLRMADMLQNPLLAPEAIASEREVVHQEFEQDCTFDLWRRELLVAQHAAEGSPYGRFDIGNRSSLAQVTEEDLRAWHKAHFTTDRLVVVMMGSASLDDLQAAATASFGKLKETTSKPPRLCRTSFSDRAKHRIFHFPSVEKKSTLCLTWELDCGHSQDLDHQAGVLLCAHLNQGGRESLIGALSERGWIQDFQASFERIARAKAHVELQLELTPAGAQKRHELLREIFCCLQTLRRSGLPKAVHEQLIRAPLEAFRFSAPEDPFEESLAMAFDLCDEPLESYPRKSLAPLRHLPADWVEVLEQMGPAFCVATMSWPSAEMPVPADQLEPWMQTPWAEEVFDAGAVLAFESAPSQVIYQPQLNPLIPEALERPSSPQNRSWQWPRPELIEQSDRAQCWLLADDHYARPEGHLELRIRSPHLDGSASSVAAGRVIQALMDRRLLALRKQAEAAGGSMQWRQTPLEWIVRVSGPPSTCQEGLSTLLRNLRGLSWTPEQWSAARASALASLEAERTDQAHTRSSRRLLSLLKRPDPIPEEIADRLVSLTDESLSKWWYQLFDRSYWQLLGYGSLERASYQRLTQRIHGILQTKPYPQRLHHAYAISAPASAGQKLEEHLSAASGCGICLALTQPLQSMSERATLRIVQPWLDAAFFQRMRSEHEAAYIAYAEQRDFCGKLGALIFQCLSHGTSSDQLLYWMQQFVKESHHQLTALFTPEVFDQTRRAAWNLWTRPPASMKGVFDFCCKAAFEEDGAFDLAERLAAAIEALSYEQALDCLEGWLGGQRSGNIAVLAGPNHAPAQNMDAQGPQQSGEAP